MSKPFYVKFEVPTEVADAAYEALQIATRTGNTRKGTNETTKAIERGIAKLVVIAEDVDPPEVVAHLPILSDERKTPYVFVPDKSNLGLALQIEVQSAAACIVDAGEASDLVKEIITRITRVREGTDK